jgi:hypothetical protein
LLLLLGAVGLATTMLILGSVAAMALGVAETVAVVLLRAEVRSPLPTECDRQCRTTPMAFDALAHVLRRLILVNDYGFFDSQTLVICEGRYPESS